MIQTLSKWSITYTFVDGEYSTIYISDNYYENILRKCSEIQFSKNVKRIDIHLIQNNTQEILAGLQSNGR